MAKKKIQSAFFCQSCGVQSPKWLGKCPTCNEWNTFVEEIISKEEKIKTWNGLSNANTPTRITDISISKDKRILTNDIELNRVLGGGIVPGSVVLLGGDPGIGKSTLLLQLALTIPNKKVMYVSGEESEHQIKMRAQRLNYSSENCFILTETSTQNIFHQIVKIETDILIIDSIQTLHTSNMESSPGSVSQIKECSSEIIKYANQTGIDALNKLSSVFASQENIEILVEGHTDNITFNQKKLIKDNWDLSVMRATSVVKILLNNKKLNPLQLTAAGRGEYNPIANNETDEGRRMNRRIEMILSPNLDDLYDILEE